MKKGGWTAGMVVSSFLSMAFALCGGALRITMFRHVCVTDVMSWAVWRMSGWTEGRGDGRFRQMSIRAGM
jgi:hypothetical protein